MTDRWQVDFRVTSPTSMTDSLQADLETVSIDSFTVNQVQTVRVGS